MPKTFAVSYRNEDGRWYLEHSAYDFACWTMDGEDSQRYATEAEAQKIADKKEQELSRDEIRGKVHVVNFD